MTSEVLRKVLVAGAAVAALSVAACTKPTTNTADAANAAADNSMAAANVATDAAANASADAMNAPANAQ
jgi:surfactin synthase thioesterase subunit